MVHSQLKQQQGGRKGPVAPPAPYLDLFKACGVDHWPRGNFERAGDASVVVDRGIGRQVVRLAGSVPAANSLRLPRRHEDSLAAGGRFLYLQLRLEVGKTYAIHADITAADRGLHRLSISNLYAKQEGARMKRSGVQVFLPAQHDAWTLLAVDLRALAQQATRSPYGKLRALQLCANMTIRGAVTSDIKYDWQTLPPDLSFTAAFDLSQAQVLWVPEEPVQDVQMALPQHRPTLPHPPLPAPPTRPTTGATAVQQQAVEPQALAPVVAGTRHQVLLQPNPIAQLQRVNAFSGQHHAVLHWVPAPNSNASSGTAGNGAATTAAEEVVFAAGPMIVGMQLQQEGQQRHLLGHSSTVRATALSADGSRLASAEEARGAALRLWDYRQGTCLGTVPGHAAGTVCLDLSPDGNLLATAGVNSHGQQELTLWDVSACWGGGSSTNSSAGRAAELARQASDYNIQAVKFVPYDPAKLAACGKNSVRVYRLKDGQLRGVSVPMDGVQAPRRPYSCGTVATAGCTAVGEVFTCLAFEHTVRVRPLEARRLFVGTMSGAVYTIEPEGRTVESVVQLHSGAVTALAVHDGFCVTGSTDSLLRVWGSDLREAYMEARHEGPVTGIALSPDGLHLVAGTDSGALSLLDISARSYTTLLRSHTAAVHAVALLGQQEGPPAQEQQQQYCTAGADGTVRVWDSTSHQQLLELTSPGEAVLSMSCHPRKLELACGFQCGAVRIFDVGSASLVQHAKQHSGRVLQLSYARRGKVLLSLGEDGCICAYAAERAYMPMSFVLAGFPLHASAMAVSQDGKLLAVAALSMGTSSGGGGSGSDNAGSASTRRPSTTGRSARVGASAVPQPVLTLFSTLTLQQTLQVPVAGRSRVVQLQVTPDCQHMLAVTADGRLLGYSCTDGSCLLDIPRVLGTPCLATALDPSGTFFLAATSSGMLHVWGLHPLHQSAPPGGGGPSSHHEKASSGGQSAVAADAAGSSRASGGTIPTITLLPSQQLSLPPGSCVHSMVFARGHRLLTVGAAGEVCCWSFCGEPCNAGAGAGTQPVDATTATLVLRQGPTAPPAMAGTANSLGQGVRGAGSDGREAVLRPVINLAADCRAAKPPSAGKAATQVDGSCLLLPAQGNSSAHDLTQQHQQQRLAPFKREQEQQQLSGSAVQQAEKAPVPRPLPAALQPHLRLPPRPSSAPLAVPKRAETETCCTLTAPAAAASDRQHSASLPSTPLRSSCSRREAPFWEQQQQQQPEASLLVTATPGERCAQVVRQERQLRITSPGKAPQLDVSKQPQHKLQARTVQWVEGEKAGDRIPPYRPSQQLQLLPPSATVQQVIGFEAAAGFSWLAGGRQLVYAASNVVLADDLTAGQQHQQRCLARLPRRVTAVAVSPDGRLAAAAVEPASEEGSSAAIHMVTVLEACTDGGTVLEFHTAPVERMAFSPDGALLVTVSRLPGGASLALWSTEQPAELVAGVQLPYAVSGLCWRTGTELPTFFTADSQGLQQWQLEPDALSSTAVHLPAALRGVALTAVAWGWEQESEKNEGRSSRQLFSRQQHQSADGVVFAGDDSGRVWQLEVDSLHQEVCSFSLLAELQGQPVTALHAASPLLAVGTAGSTLLLLQHEGWSGREAAWRLALNQQLDSAVASVHLDGESRSAIAATTCGTLWRACAAAPAGRSSAPEVLLCGQQHAMASWQLAQGALWKGTPAAAAVASASGIAVWQLGEGTSSCRVPLVEFPLPAGASCASLAQDGSCCAVAHADGHISLYATIAACLRWKVASHRGDVAALAVMQRLRGCKVMVAYRSGVLYMLDGSSGQIAHRTLQFAVQQDSGRLCPSNFEVAGLAVCPSDNAMFALCGQQQVVVCKAHWTKNAAVSVLARLNFGAADDLSAAAVPGAAPSRQHTPAVQAAFSHAHPSHIYLTNPTDPGQLLLFDYSTHAVIKTLLAPVSGGAGITALALHPKESLLAAGTTQGSVLLLRLDTEAWTEVAAHPANISVVGLAFSPCGGKLFSAAGTATFVWDVPVQSG